MYSTFNDVISQQKVNNEIWFSRVKTDQKASQLLWTRCSRCHSRSFLDFPQPNQRPFTAGRNKNSSMISRPLMGVTILAEAIHG